MSTILAKTTLAIIINSFKKVSLNEHKAFRVKNLLAEEIAALVDLWHSGFVSGTLNDIKLVVASSLDGKILDDYVADPSLSITWYRNNIKSGLVYLETEDQSDSQGLQNFFTLRDSNFLDGSFDKEAAPFDSVIELMIDSAWKETERKIKLPELLRSKVEFIIKTIHFNIEPVPVRKFIQFAVEVCKVWQENVYAKDEKMADAIIGSCFWSLNLFPDENWRDENSEIKTQRHLELNSRYADLRTTSGDMDSLVLLEKIEQTNFLDLKGNSFSSGK